VPRRGLVEQTSRVATTTTQVHPATQTPSGERGAGKWAASSSPVAMKLADLPPDLHKSFHPYATDGTIDYAKLPVNNPDKGMPLEAYPEALRETIRAFDVNGDGYVEMHELARAAELYKESKNTSKRLGQLVVVLVAIIGVLVGVTAACTYAVVDAAKETEVSGDGAMHVKGKSDVVATTGVAEKTEDIFDFVNKDQVDVAGVKTLTLKTGATTRQYTVTGYEVKIGELSFFTATGHTVTVTPTMYSIYNANGSTLASVTKASSRRRSLLAAGGGSTVTTGVSTGGSAASSISMFLPSDYENTMSTTSVVYVNDVKQTSGTLVAMVGSDIRGYNSAFPGPPFGPYAGSMMFLCMLHSNDNGEDFTFKFIEDSGAEHDVVISEDGASWDGKFVPNDNAGNAIAPLVLKSVPPSPFASYTDKMTLVAFLQLGTPVNWLVTNGKFSAYSLEDGSLRGESTAPAAYWFDMYPVWSIDIHGSKFAEMIEFRFENDAGTYILNQKQLFKANTQIGSLEPNISPTFHRVAHVTAPAPPPAAVEPAVPKPTLPIDLTQFKNDASVMMEVRIDAMKMTSGMVVAYDGTTPLGGTDNIRKDPLGRWVAMFNIGGHDATQGNPITFYFWGNPDTCTACEAIALDVYGKHSVSFTPNHVYGTATKPYVGSATSDPNFAIPNFEYSMTLYAKVKIDGTYVTEGKLTAYEGNRIVGVIASPLTPDYLTKVNRQVPPIPGIPDGFYEFMIYNDSNYVQGITFKYTKTDGTEIDLTGSITFENGAHYDLMNMVDLSN